MSDAMHEPKSWAWTDDRDHSGYIYLTGVLMTDMTDGTPWGDELDQDKARVIAAAPDLLEALKRAVKQLEDHGFDGLASGANAAIAKAEGQDHD